jgi:hypothetical protein
MKENAGKTRGKSGQKKRAIKQKGKKRPAGQRAERRIDRLRRRHGCLPQQNRYWK